MKCDSENEISFTSKFKSRKNKELNVISKMKFLIQVNLNLEKKQKIKFDSENEISY